MLSKRPKVTLPHYKPSQTKKKFHVDLSAFKSENKQDSKPSKKTPKKTESFIQVEKQKPILANRDNERSIKSRTEESQYCAPLSFELEDEDLIVAGEVEVIPTAVSENPVRNKQSTISTTLSKDAEGETSKKKVHASAPERQEEAHSKNGTTKKRIKRKRNCQLNYCPKRKKAKK